MKKVRIMFTDEGASGNFHLPGMESVIAKGPRTLEFMFSGDVNELTGRISGFSLENLSIEEPPLEEIFLHYYK